MKNWRKYMALVLLAVYLQAVGGPAFLSLSCRCAMLNGKALSGQTGFCCSAAKVAAAGDLSDVAAIFRTGMHAPCCGHHHSTDIELYTSNSDLNSDRMLRCAVVELLPALLAGLTPLLSEEAPAVGFVEWRPLLYDCGFVRSAGLRAPPVLA